MGEGENWRRVVLAITTKSVTAKAGLVYMGGTRVKSPNALGIAESPADRDTILSIGKSAECQKRKAFSIELEKESKTSMTKIEKWILVEASKWIKKLPEVCVIFGRVRCTLVSVLTHRRLCGQARRAARGSVRSRRL